MLLRLEGVYKPPRDLVRNTDSDSAGLEWLVQPLKLLVNQPTLFGSKAPVNCAVACT